MARYQSCETKNMLRIEEISMPLTHSRLVNGDLFSNLISIGYLWQSVKRWETESQLHWVFKTDRLTPIFSNRFLHRKIRLFQVNEIHPTMNHRRLESLHNQSWFQLYIISAWIKTTFCGTCHQYARNLFQLT